jgi:hypothetical protein
LAGIGINGSQNKRQPVLGAKRAELASSKETVAGWLKPYSIGEKLKTLRLKKKLGLVELGTRGSGNIAHGSAPFCHLVNR